MDAKTLREQILATTDRKSEAVVVPEWGNAKVVIKTITAGEREQIENMREKDGDNPTVLRARLLAFALHAEDGNKLFTVDDIPALAERSAPVIIRLNTIAMRLNALTEAAVDDKTKNSDADQPAAS
jgi:hypothetical protein